MDQKNKIHHVFIKQVPCHSVHFSAVWAMFFVKEQIKGHKVQHIKQFKQPLELLDQIMAGIEKVGEQSEESVDETQRSGSVSEQGNQKHL